MNLTKIEWVKNPDGTQGYTFNPITGCLNHVNGMCKGGNFPCYAYRLAHGRLKQRYCNNVRIAFNDKTMRREGGRSHPALTASKAYSDALQDPFYPRFWPERLMQPLKHKEPCGIFPVDMGDWCGIGIPIEWSHALMGVIVTCPQHRFYLLTKQPQNLLQWSPFPGNCWVGVTITEGNNDAASYLKKIEAKVKYISLEPLLKWAMYGVDKTAEALQLAGINWVIIGAQTRPTVYPKIEWVKEIVEAADKAGVKVFLKNNLLPLIKDFTMELGENYRLISYDEQAGYHKLRQEIPQV